VAALAETGWTDNTKKNYTSFKEREAKLNMLYKHYDWKACQDIFTPAK